jgi:hypothetical protein
MQLILMTNWESSHSVHWSRIGAGRASSSTSSRVITATRQRSHTLAKLYGQAGTLAPLRRSALRHASRAPDRPHSLPKLHLEVLLEAALADHVSTALHGGHERRLTALGADQAVRPVGLRGALPDDGRDGLPELLHLARLPERNEEPEVARTPGGPRWVGQWRARGGHPGVRGSELVVEGLLEARRRAFQRGEFGCEPSFERGRAGGAENEGRCAGLFETL